MPVIAPAIGSGISGLISGITGMSQKHEANKLLKGLVFPEEKLPSEIAGLENQGLPSEQYNKAMKDIQRQQQQAIGASQDRRGGLATISNVTAASNDATTNLNAKDAEQRVANQKYIAGWKDKLWDNNVKQRYDRDYNYGMQLKGMGNQNLMGGVDKLVSGGLMGMGGGMNQGMGYNF